MAKPLKLTVEEKQNLLDAIKQARRRVMDFGGDDMTDADARTILREHLLEPLNTILRNHKKERLLT